MNSSEPAESSADPLKMRWYTVDAPWANSGDAGLTIIAGSNDPHVGIFVLDLAESFGELDAFQIEFRRSLAQHIIELHNYMIGGMRMIEPIPPVVSANTPGS